LQNKDRDVLKSRYGECLLIAAKKIVMAGGFFAAYICLPAMLLLIISDPFLRYFVGRPFFWSNEVSTFLMILMAFAGFGTALHKGQHVRVILLFSKLPHQVQNILWVVVSLLTSIYIGLLSFTVFRLAFSSLSINALTPTANLVFFPWQLLAGLGLFTFFLALILFTAKRIAIASSKKEAKEEDSELEGYGM
jgi:TRAP-type C4-dicarboxylate transport system permease small subunit